MLLEILPIQFSVCQVENLQDIPFDEAFCFVSKTDTELSVVCPTAKVPKKTLACEDNWCAFRVAGILDFALIGVLAHLATVLAEKHVSIFAVSTYNTDYLLLPTAQMDAAIPALAAAGYEIVPATQEIY